MPENGIMFQSLPELKSPVLIIGFDGWGNALNVSKAMADYLIRKMNGEYFARLNSDLFYNYNESRPLVNISNGSLNSILPPGGSFYSIKSREKDLVVLRANEPTIGWFHFVNDLLSLCVKLDIDLIITLGSMYDNVLHTDRIVSAIASNETIFSRLSQKNVIPINYQGPSAIHSTIQSEGKKQGFDCVSLWCHCPYYLQGATHFGLLSHMGDLLSYFIGVDIDLEELNTSWKELNSQIQALIEKNPELKDMVAELRKAKVRGSWESMKESTHKDNKVILLKDFQKPI